MRQLKKAATRRGDYARIARLAGLSRNHVRLLALGMATNPTTDTVNRVNRAIAKLAAERAR